jgi:hypothetical protein
VPHERGGDGGKRLGVVIERVGRDAEQRVRIPIQPGHRFRFEAGRDSDLMSTTIPK